MARTKRKQQVSMTNVFRPFVALALGWLIPGAGHVYIGRARRGVIIFIAVAAMFWSGIAIGGVMTVDSRYERWWFLADMLTGAHGAVGWYRARGVYKELTPKVLSDEAYRSNLAMARLEVTNRQHRTMTTADELKVRRQYYDKLLVDKGMSLVPPGETVARAYAGVAGLMNLLCMFDAMILAAMGAGAEPTPPRVRIVNDAAGTQDGDDGRGEAT